MQSAVTLLVLAVIYGAAIAGLVKLIRHYSAASKYAIFLSFRLFGLATGLLVVQLWPSDSSVLPNTLGVWLGDWIYHQSTGWMGNPYSDQANDTIPWVFQIPQVYAFASISSCVLAGILLQCIESIGRTARATNKSSRE